MNVYMSMVIMCISNRVKGFDIHISETDMAMSVRSA